MQQGDIGAPIRLELVNGLEDFEIPTGSTVELWIRQPSGRLLRRTFDIVDAANGVVYYETVAGDIAEWGVYRIQARVITPAGDSFAFSPIDETVGRNVFPAALYILPDPAFLPLGAPEVVVS